MQRSRKLISELKAEDLQELVAKGWPENENVEFKSELPARQNAKYPWYTGGKVGDLAKEKLFKEIVAFANRSGSRLFSEFRSQRQSLQEQPRSRMCRNAMISPKYLSAQRAT